jgi:hypothetical protein
MPEIDGLDHARVEVRVPAEATNGRDRIRDTDGSRDDLGQHRLEDNVVLAAHEPQFDVAAGDLFREQLLERQRRIHTAEAAAEDENARRP